MNNDKLWVFDTNNFLEVYAPTLDEAEEQLKEIEEASGLDFKLVDTWMEYQKEHQECKDLSEKENNLND